MKSLPTTRFMATMGLIILLLLTGCAKPISPISTTTRSAAVTTTSTPAATTPTGPYGDLKMALSAYGTETWDPIKTETTSAAKMLSPVFDFMFWINSGKLTPGVIEKWDLAPDALSWTYRVRKGIKFSNGDDLTAKDVKFTLDRYLSKDAYAANLRNSVKSVDIVDDLAVRLNTNGIQLYLPYLSTVLPQAQGLVQPKNYIEKNGIDYFIKNPIGAGAYKLVEYKVADEITYEAVNNHWRQTPAFKTFKTMLIPDESTRVAALKTGMVDVTPVNLDNSVQLEKSGFKVYTMTETQPLLFFHGTYDPRAAGMPAADVRVRQALMIAVNRAEIAKTYYQGKGGHVTPPEVHWGQPDLPDPDTWYKYAEQTFRYDPDEAKKLLAQAGYASGFSGLKIYSFVSPSNPYQTKMVEIVQAMWAKIGVNVSIVPITDSVMYSWRQEPNVALVGQASIQMNSSFRPIPVALEAAYGNKGVNRLTGMAGNKTGTPDLEALISASSSEVDRVKQNEIIAKAIKMSSETYVVGPMPSMPAVMAAGPAVSFNLKYPVASAHETVFVTDAVHAK